MLLYNGSSLKLTKGKVIDTNKVFAILHPIQDGPKGVIILPGIRVREGESFEAALRRFKKQCEKGGILSEIKKREHYEKPSVRRKKKSLAARKRNLKKLRKTVES